jgi:hypothetical protein
MNTADQLIDQIKQLKENDLLEAGIYYFSDKFDISSREEIQKILFSFCEEQQADYSELMSIESAIEKDRESYRKLLRLLLIHEANSGENEYQKVKEAVDSVGQKQVITEIGLAIILGTMATLILSGYALEVTGGKIKATKQITRETKPDGTIVVTETTETIYVDALSPLGNLLNFFSNIPKSK